jgi:hypothetical protein
VSFEVLCPAGTVADLAVGSLGRLGREVGESVWHRCILRFEVSMAGFLRDDVRDYIAVSGLALAVLQTWLAVKAVRKARRSVEGTSSDSVVKPAPLPRASWGEDVEFEHDGGSCLFVVAGIVAVGGAATVYVAVLGYFAFLTRCVESVAGLFATVLFLAVFIGGILIVQWSRATGSRPVLTASFVYGLWIAVTVSAAYALWWCIGKNTSDPLVRAAFGSSTTILVPIVCTTVQLFFYGLWQGLKRLWRSTI